MLWQACSSDLWEFFLHSGINMPLDLNTDEVSELGIHSKLSLVEDNLS